MSAVAPLRDDSGALDPQLRVRLETYARYAATLARQEEALVAGDLELFGELAELRRELQDSVSGSAPLPTAIGTTPETLKAIEQGRSQLRDAAAREGRIRQRLLEMRRDTAASLRNLGNREAHLKHYAREDEPAPDASEKRRLDIKL